MTNNTRQENLHLHGQMAADWWQKEGPARALHVMNVTRLQWVMVHVDLADKMVLDVGCGAGIFAESVAPHCKNVCGIDAGEAMVVAAKAHAGDRYSNLTYHHTTLEDWTDSPIAQYDVVTCFELLEHVPAPEQLLQAAVSRLKPNGWLFVSTLNRTWRSFLEAIVVGEHVLDIVPKGTHAHADFIKPSEIDRCLQSLGCEFRAQTGMRWRPGMDVAEFVRDVDVNYAMAYQKADD